jgi:hypothetical protein
MPIQLEEERAPLPPVVKFTALAQNFNGAVIRVQQRDRLKRDEATDALVPMLKPDGKPQQELVVTCLTLPGTTCFVVQKGNEFVPEKESIVRLILKGKSFSEWITTKGELGRPVQVGDIVNHVAKHAQVYNNGKADGNLVTDQAVLDAVPRGRNFGIYGPVTLRAPKNGSEWITKAEAAYHNTREPIAAETVTQEDPYADVPPNDDDPPF